MIRFLLFKKVTQAVNKLVLTCMIACLFPPVIFAQKADYKWWNPAKNNFPVIEGQAWPKEVHDPYDRLPARAKKNVSKNVWNLSHQSAGLMVRFKSNTPEIVVRYTAAAGRSIAMPHMPATGVSGVDLYAINADGNELWCAGKYAFGDTITYRFQNLEPNDPYHKKGREYRLFLPLYNAVKWLEIGVPDTVAFTLLPTRPEKPIVVYGTSIAQGGCASRPGMAWTSILSRRLDRPLINLGFSGNGRLDKEVIDLLTEVDAKIYILDCLPNLTSSSVYTPTEVKNRIIQAVVQIRQKRPSTPILLTDHAGYSDELINPVHRKESESVNGAQREAFAVLKQDGVSDIYLLTKNEIGLDINSTVDGTHPNDLGMMQYAIAYEKIIRNIIKEPIGIYTTTQPRTQTRDAHIYDWETRHRYILQANALKKPDVIFLGNSITHYWGGLPHGPIESASDVKNPFFESLNAADLGYGWDRVENVLWRIYHGELDGYKARQAVLFIGTNNLGLNTDGEILEGIKFLVHGIEERQPDCKILLLGLLPRRAYEKRVATFNEGLAQLAGMLNVGYADAGGLFLKEDGKIDESLFSDGLHPTAEGYRKLENFLLPYVRKTNENNSKKVGSK